MMLFKNMKIGAKLTLFIVIMEILIVAVAYRGISLASEMADDYGNIIKYDVEASDAAREMGMHFQKARVSMLLGLRADDPAKANMFFGEMEKDLQEADACLKAIEAVAESDKAKATVASITAKYNDFRQGSSAAIKASQSGTVRQTDPATQAAENAKYAKLENDIADELHNVAELAKSDAENRSKAMDDTLASNIRTIIIVTIVMVVVSLAVGIMFNMDVKKRLLELSQAADRIAQGDLATEVATSTGDELGDAAASFEVMRQRMHESIMNIQDASDQVAAGAKNVSDASIALSQGASEQAASIQQLSASITEIASQTASNADNADNANGLTMKARNQAEIGNQDMKEMLDAMEEINSSSANISKIIKVIDEIAFQTNILALNAAVEAARAGQHGKGFAVVAEEVRNLAARSAKAAKETTDMIEGSIEKVGQGRAIANKTAEALDAIVADVAEVADIVSNIAKASNEQKLALEQINQGVQQVSQVVQSNSSTSEEAASASQQLSAQADLMRETANKFKLGDNAHRFSRAMQTSYSSNAIQRPAMGGSKPAITPATPGVKPKTIALTDDEGFGKY